MVSSLEEEASLSPLMGGRDIGRSRVEGRGRESMSMELVVAIELREKEDKLKYKHDISFQSLSSCVWSTRHNN